MHIHVYICIYTHIYTYIYTYIYLYTALFGLRHAHNVASEEYTHGRQGLRTPPGLYEWTTAERFAQLMSKGYFNMVIIFLWFWYDPQPSVAELVLPVC